MLQQNFTAGFSFFHSDEETEQWRGNWENGNNESTSVPKRSVMNRRSNSQKQVNFLFGGSDCSSDEDL